MKLKKLHFSWCYTGRPMCRNTDKIEIMSIAGSVQWVTCKRCLEASRWAKEYAYILAPAFGRKG